MNQILKQYFCDENALIQISEELISILRKSKKNTNFSHNQFGKIIKLKAKIIEMQFLERSQHSPTTFFQEPKINNRIWLDLYSSCEEVVSKDE